MIPRKIECLSFRPISPDSDCIHRLVGHLMVDQTC